jgi:hypothetical protein
LFTIFSSATEGTQNDEMLLMMAEYMNEIDSLEEVKNNSELLSQTKDKFTLKFKVPTDRSNHPLLYLIRSKRFNVLKEYFEVYNEVTLEMILVLLQTINP